MIKNNALSGLQLGLSFPCMIIAGSTQSINSYIAEKTSFVHQISIHCEKDNRDSGFHIKDIIVASGKSDCYLCDINTLNQNIMHMYPLKSALPSYLGYFEEEKVIGFIDSHEALLEAVQSSINRVKQIFDPEASLALSLFEEGEEWRTLFLNITTDKPWESIRDFRSEEWDRLEVEYPSVSNIINFQFC